MKWSALILAGGASQRMGRDKSWLEVGGVPLLARQVGLARSAGAEELFISGRPGVDYSGFHCQVLLDQWQDCGPLGGIERGLAEARSALVLVLAVDLPNLEVHFLRKLLEECTEDRGVVPRRGELLEPLVAVYPKRSHDLAVQLLEGRHNAVQEFASACERRGMVRFLPVCPEDGRYFANWNRPEDVHL